MRYTFETVDRNLRSAMQFFGRATGEGEVVERPELLLIHSGLQSGIFNMALLSVEAGTVELVERLNQAAAYFARRATPWSVWLCEQWVASVTPAEVSAEFALRGFRQINHPPAMIAERLSEPVRPLPPIEARRVDDGATRLAFATICSTCFDIPFRTAARFYEGERSWQFGYHGFVGYADGAPVCAMATVMTEEAIGVYSLGTLPEHRKRGYGEALMRKVLAEIVRREGERPTVLQSSESGYPLYRRMGYRRVGSYRVFLSGG
ncbi:MAG: GNAT family N-acetyltransferase [Bryobacteraceae bacterium]|nr:GNAT family N-acetyltransferase [Bryobacteraceae bacterium]